MASNSAPRAWVLLRLEGGPGDEAGGLHAQDPSLHGGNSYGEFSNKASTLASGPAPTVRYSGVLRRKPSAWDLEQAERTVSRGRRCAQGF